MKYRTLSNSKLKVSLIGVGTWSFGTGAYWGPQDQNDVDVVVNTALDNGVNYFDTAEMYNAGASEKSLGIALNKKDRRNEAIIGSKISPANCNSDLIRKSVNQSLKNLNTDYLDIYMLHWPIEPHSIEHFTKDNGIISNPPNLKDTFKILMKLQEDGKIRYIGVSNHGTQQMEEVLATGSEIVVNEMPYNLFSRAIEIEIIPFCNKKKIGIFGYMALQQGILSGKYKSAAEIPPPQAHSRHFKQERGLTLDGTNYSRHYEMGCEIEIFDALNQIRTIAMQENVSIPQLSLAWAMSNEIISCTLVGCRNLEQLQMNIEAVNYRLPIRIRNELNKITQPILDILGPNPDYYENRSKSRIR
jgi:myo-inositol catabolism protein IolS